MADALNAFVPGAEVRVAGRASGPLTDLTFAAKDLFDVAGYPTSGGNPLALALSGIKATTAPTVQKLLDAGARFFFDKSSEFGSIRTAIAEIHSRRAHAEPRRNTG